MADERGRPRSGSNSPFENSRHRPSPPPGHPHTLVGGREGERAGTDAKIARTRIFEQTLRTGIAALTYPG